MNSPMINVVTRMWMLDLVVVPGLVDIRLSLCHWVSSDHLTQTQSTVDCGGELLGV